MVCLLVLWTPFFGGVEWQWRQAGSEAWWMVLASHPSSGGVVSRGKQEGRGSGIEGCRAVRVGEGHVVDVAVFEVVKWVPLERVQEPTAKHAPGSIVESLFVGEVWPPGIAKYRATAAAEAVASTSVESLDGCEVRPQGVEVPEFVFGDRIQQRAFEHLAGFSQVVEIQGVPFLVCQDTVKKRHFRGSGGALSWKTATDRSVEEPGFIACRRAAGKRLISLRIACRRVDADKRTSPEVTCRRVDAGKRLILRKACRRDIVGKSPGLEFACPSTKFCAASTDSRSFALWMAEFSSHRRTRSGNALLSVTSHVPCLSKSRKTKLEFLVRIKTIDVPVA